MYILDTDVLIWILRGKEDTIAAVKKLGKLRSLGISVITVAEIYKNIFPTELYYTEELIKNHIVLEADTEIAKMAGFYWQQYKLKLANLTLDDCLIAATAKINQATLVTYNTKHFPMRDIEVLSPTDLK